MSDKTIQLTDYLSEIHELDQSGLSLRNKYIRLRRILERSCKEITNAEFLQFPSLFSRLVFIAQKYELPKQLERQLQSIRVKSTFLNRNEQNIISLAQYNQAKDAVVDLINFIGGYRNTNPDEDRSLDEEKLPTHSERLRVQVVDIKLDDGILVCESDEYIGVELSVKYNIPSVNDIFNESINRVWIGAQLNLIDVKVDSQGNYIPGIFVLEPDYLIDASAMAECFQSYGSSYLHYFRRKFEPPASSPHILLGNLANFFLDELIYAENPEDVLFSDVFLQSFRSMPFEYAACKEIKENTAFREFMQKAEKQFENIKRVILYDMPANGFDAGDCILEPSFLCETYGFQGRLDLLQLSVDDKEMDRIIELKSGKPPYPREDVTKIAPNHEVQTAIYRLMIQSVFGKDARHIYPAILYSAADNPGENLRYVAAFKQLEKEIINERNKIVATEYDLYKGTNNAVENTFAKLFDIDNYGRIPQFFIDKLHALKLILDKASDIEKAYFFRFVSFINRELYCQKLGDESYGASMSISALWNIAYEERKEALEVISGLNIEEIDDTGRGMTIYFSRQDEDDCVNFREGEICILYPHQNENDSVLTNQILKGTVVEISSSRLVLRFRYKQRNRHFFYKYEWWAVEHDKLDHAYTSMLKSLFAFLSASEAKKKMLLGLSRPVSSYNEKAQSLFSKKEKEQSVIDKAVAADDYFLIVGPPGTGKTSIFARKLVEHFYTAKSTNILVIAYTNRAVDELCAAICAVFEEEGQCDKYIRIGTELSCDKLYRRRLLQNISCEVKNRKELLDTIYNTRIFVGTLASVTGKPELFNLKHFDVAIIDEASQIVEPQIIGLLPQFDKFIMIGDHKQLSTITLQDKEKSKVDDTLLNSIGLNDCRESLFERLFSLCRQNGWKHAYDTLTYHGRMHEEIANLINGRFYDNQLIAATDRQKRPLDILSFDDKNKFQNLVATKRVAFIPVREKDVSNNSDKTNHREAEMVVNMVKAILDVYKANGRAFDPYTTLGVITPYRNQIAIIRRKIEESGIPELKDIMIDTVERYQGSQRDIIIFSFCFNQPYQMKYFSNINREGNVDRKLNVALTRAREQLFLIGNDGILQQNPIYKDLLESIDSVLL